MSIALIDGMMVDAYADGESNWGATMNQNLVRTGWLVSRAVKTVGNNTPVVGVDNDRHIVGTAPTGAWATHANQMARQNAATAGGYDFLTVPDDIDVLNYANGNTYRKVAGLWVVLTPPAPTGNPFPYVNPTGTVYNVPSDGVTDCLASINAMLTAAPDGTCFMFPAGNYKITGTVSIPAGKHFRFFGAGSHKTIFTTNSATLDMFSIGDWQTTFQGISFQTSVTRTAGYAINYGANAECFLRDCTFLAMFNGVLINGTISGIDTCVFTNTVNFSLQYNGAVVNGYVVNSTFDCSPATVAHVEVNQCGSLLISGCDIIHATNNLRVNPTSPNGAFAIYAVNTFFDTAAGSSVKVMGTGNVQRMKFVNCWLSGSVNGLEFASTAATLPTAIDLINCDILSNSANGVLATAVQDFSVSSCRVAGNVTAGINIVAAAGAVTKFNICDNKIGPTGGIGANGTGVLIAAGTYGGYLINGNDVNGNTTANINDGGSVTAFVQKMVGNNVGHLFIGGGGEFVVATAVAANANTVIAGGTNIFPIPKNSLSPKSFIRATIVGSFTGTATATAFQLHLGPLGTTADPVILTASVTGAVGTSQGRGILECLFRTVGAAGTVAGALQWLQNAVTGLAAATTNLIVGTTTTAPNTTVDNYLTLSMLTAAAGSSGTVQLAALEIVNT